MVDDKVLIIKRQPLWRNGYGNVPTACLFRHLKVPHGKQQSTLCQDFLCKQNNKSITKALQKQKDETWERKVQNNKCTSFFMELDRSNIHHTISLVIGVQSKERLINGLHLKSDMNSDLGCPGNSHLENSTPSLPPPGKLSLIKLSLGKFSTVKFPPSVRVRVRIMFTVGIFRGGERFN